MGWRWWVAVAGRAGRCRGGPGAAGDLQGTCLSFMGLRSSEIQLPGPLPTLPLSCPGECLSTHAPLMFLSHLCSDELSASLVQTQLLPPTPPPSIHPTSRSWTRPLHSP